MGAGFGKCLGQGKDKNGEQQHYCLGFDINEQDEHLENFFDIDKNTKELGTCQCRIFPIEYVKNDQRPEFHISDKDGINEGILEQKFQAWSYEKEVRIMVRSNEARKFPCNLNYQADKLREVVFGANMKVEQFLAIYGVIDEMKKYKKLNINVFVATMSSAFYHLIICELLNTSIINIRDNYRKLQYPDKWLFLHDEPKRLADEFTPKKVLKAWRSALNNISINDCIVEIKAFSDVGLEKYLKQGGQRICPIGLYRLM